MRAHQEYKFFAEDFWNLINTQKYTCALTGRELTPMNTEVELRRPKISLDQGRAEISNHYLVDKALSQLCRYLSEDEIIDIAAEIIRYRGKEKGFFLRKGK
ncbi:MAG: hypothetical protein ACRCUT_07445 [Spirochaetota bacterium]